MTSHFDTLLFEIAGTPVTVATLVVFSGIILVTLVVSWLVQKAVTRFLRLRKVKEEGSLEVARRLMHYLTLAIGTAVALQTVGINLSALFAAGAVFAIGLGFAMQNIAQNFVSGIILLTERTIKPGDVLEVDTRFVRVIRMGIRATVVRTLDDEEVIIPNSNIVQSSVVNYTLHSSLYRLRTQVGVTYSSDLRLVREVLEKVALDTPWRQQEREPVVQLRQFGSSSVDYEVSVWIEDPWGMWNCRSKLNEAIWWAFKEHDIVIAFPQLDLHLDPPVVTAMEAGSRREGMG